MSNTKQRDPYYEQYRKLLGKVALRVVWDSQFGQKIYGIQFSGGTTAWILQDPEGNGPGFLEIQEPEKKKPEKPPPGTVEAMWLTTQHKLS